jgi:hypothetical protein
LELGNPIFTLACLYQYLCDGTGGEALSCDMVRLIPRRDTIIQYIPVVTQALARRQEAPRLNTEPTIFCVQVAVIYDPVDTK